MDSDDVLPWTQQYLSPKRSACDRCRNQKLRCARGHSAETCARCARLGVRCIMSSTNGNHQSNLACETDDSTQRPSKTRRLRPKAVLPPHPLSLPTQQEMSSVEMENAMTAGPNSGTNDAQICDSFPGPDDPFQLPVSDNHMDVFNSMVIYGEFDGIDLNTGGLLYPDRDNCSPLLSQPTLATSCALNPSNFASDGDMAGMEYTPQQSTASSKQPPVVVEWDHRLSLACFELSRRLDQCQALARRDTGSPSSDTGSPDGGVGTKAQKQCNTPWTPELFGDTLRDTSEFLSVIRSYDQSIKESGYASAHLGIIVVLNVLSAYFQIITIYDKLLQSLYKQLFEAYPPSSSQSVSSSAHTYGEAGLQILPGLQLAGFSVQRGNLQTKLLMEVMLDQFATIERLLGLPAELLVTDRQKRESNIWSLCNNRQGRVEGEIEERGGGKEGENDRERDRGERERGLFAHSEYAKGLLAAIISDGDHSSYQPTTDSLGLHALFSLRNTIKEVNKLLDTSTDNR